MAIADLQPSSMVVRVTMDMFQHPYYKFNKTMMTLIGQWPEQSTRTRYGCRVVVIYFYVSEIVSRIRTITNNHESLDMVRDCMIEMFIQIGGITVYLGLISISQTTVQLLNRIRTDWQVWAREREVNILHEHAELGKILNIAFAVMMYGGGILILMEPIIEKIIDIFLMNNTEPGKFILMVDYYHVDEQKYYFYVITYFNVASIVIGAPILTNAIMLISYTQHGSGIFAALRHRLESIRHNDASAETENASCPIHDTDVVQISWCIARHNDAIEYVNLIEAAYTWNFFICTGLGMILANGLGLLVLTQPNNLQVTMTCISLILLMGSIFLTECLASQILTDYSINISVYIYNMEWYGLSVKAQKLLQFMIMRCNVPCQLTAGNMMVMSIRNVWIVAKTTLSYFAFVRSTQGF